MRICVVELEVVVEIPDDVDLDSAQGYARALDIAVLDVSTRSESEIRDTIIDIELGEN